MEIKLVIGMEKEMYERIDRLTEALTGLSKIKMLIADSENNGEIKQSTKSEVSEKVNKEIKSVKNDTEVPWEEENKTSGIKYTVDDVISAMQNLGAKKGKQEAKGLLEKYNAAKVSQLDESVYEDIIKDIERMI